MNIVGWLLCSLFYFSHSADVLRNIVECQSSNSLTRIYWQVISWQIIFGTWYYSVLSNGRMAKVCVLICYYFVQDFSRMLFSSLC